MNYDLNIWDKVGHELNYEQSGWAISVYEIPCEGSAYGSGVFIRDLDLEDDEVERLTLGKKERDGGYYTEDSDFWLDLESFTKVYKDIPLRVSEFLAGVSEHGGKGQDDVLFVR